MHKHIIKQLINKCTHNAKHISTKQIDFLQNIYVLREVMYAKKFKNMKEKQKIGNFQKTQISDFYQYSNIFKKTTKIKTNSQNDTFSFPEAGLGGIN